jgi:hypothetical protein
MTDESSNNCQSIASNHNISKDKSPLWNQKFGFQFDYANVEKDDALRTAVSFMRFYLLLQEF